MNILKGTLLIALLHTSFAFAAPATESSIKELLEITQVGKTVENSRAQLNSLLNVDTQRELKGTQPNPAQQKAINNMKSKMSALLASELAWNKLEPRYIQHYKETFTEEEIKGMLEFYKTPTGQAVINKMPKITQYAMQETRKMMTDMAPHMQQIQREFAADMAAASEKQK